MVIYTSYFKNPVLKNIPIERQFSIARGTPETFKGDKYSLSFLFPEWDWIKLAHAGLWHRYVEKYQTILDSFEADDIIRIVGDGGILICHCMPWQNCHRQLIADKLRKAGYEVVELEAK